MSIAKSGGIDLILGSLAPSGGVPKYIYVVVQGIPDVALGCYLSGGQPVIFLDWTGVDFKRIKKTGNQSTSATHRPPTASSNDCKPSSCTGHAGRR